MRYLLHRLRSCLTISVLVGRPSEAQIVHVTAVALLTRSPGSDLCTPEQLKAKLKRIVGSLRAHRRFGRPFALLFVAFCQSQEHKWLKTPGRLTLRCSRPRAVRWRG